MEEIAGSEAGEINRCQVRIEPCKEFEFIVLTLWAKGSHNKVSEHYSQICILDTCHYGYEEKDEVEASKSISKLLKESRQETVV